MQISFKLPEINREDTKKAVEEALTKYQMFLLMEPEEISPKITASFTLTPPSNTNEFHSKTEDLAVKRLDQEIARKRYLNKIRKAVNRLAYNERSVIIKRYLGSDDVFDYEVYNELGFSERKYYRLKSRAFYKLAFILKIEVYEEQVKPS
ncbi:ArpU family transcriptional regulator [Salinibacillus aidingensis]|uniref:ArpU family transcriptional regulator n=1 Tax=Salinibacillus aidingensis TaxID=237684 RepID=A0ABN1B6B7_9BACI